MSMVYYGEKTCESSTKNGECKNKAYYIYNNQYVCGVHSKKEHREKLPKRSKNEEELIKKNEYDKHKITIEEARKKNGRGDVKLQRMYMMKSVPLVKGYLNVFPNYKDQNRKYGFGCSSLSPKSMGPVFHGQPNLPIALNLENFFQGSKVYRNEININNNPNSIFYEKQIEFFEDIIPHRHKYKKDENNPTLYFLWKDKKGKEHHLTYIESRQFYCTFYEIFANDDKNFHILKDYVDHGYNLQICGYDAFEMKKYKDETLSATIERYYLNEQHPFGHERTLYTMLLLKPDEYPWKKYKTFEF